MIKENSELYAWKGAKVQAEGNLTIWSGRRKWALADSGAPKATRTINAKI